jgi:RNA polymerase sigma factor (sigma-70 family)
MFQCDCPPNDCAARVSEFLHGDRKAGDVLVEKFTGLVKAIVARVLGSSRREDWDDATQTIFLRLFTNLDRWERKCPFCKWLAVVAARRAIDLSKLSEPTTRIPLEQIADSRPAAPDPETIERIGQIVKGFPEEWQSVWEAWLQGERREDTAKRLGRSLRTIQYWLAEMMDEIRESLR